MIYQFNPISSRWKQGLGGAESSITCSKGKQEKNGFQEARIRVSKPTPTVTLLPTRPHLLQQDTPPEQATPPTRPHLLQHKATPPITRPHLPQQSQTSYNKATPSNPSQNNSSNGDQVFKYMRLWGPYPSNHHTPPLPSQLERQLRSSGLPGGCFASCLSYSWVQQVSVSFLAF